MNATASELLTPGRNGAFVKDGLDYQPNVTPTSSKLSGLRLAVKDVFAIEGFRIGAGNPVWWKHQPISLSTAPAVTALLAAGASWAGKTVTDELAFSLTGVNKHYGTPTNPASPQRLPGGSSSGSAVAVANSDADIGLATDCGGSARLPASNCGIWGMRPTHGALEVTAGFPLAPSFDTVGWFARSANVLARTLAVLLPLDQLVAPASFLIPEDAIAVCDPAVQTAFRQLQRQLARIVAVNTIPVDTLPLEAWAQAHRILQGDEIWRQHGEWVTRHGHELAEDVRLRFLVTSQVTENDVAQQSSWRADAQARLSELLVNERVLLMPTAPTVAPLCNAPESDLAAHRRRAQLLLSPAGLAGLPQVSLPWMTLQGAPIGLSVVGARGTDALVMEAGRLIDFAISGTYANEAPELGIG